MGKGDLDFTFDAATIDRQALLTEAAEELDALRGYLGGGEEAERRKVREGDLVRAFAEDVAEFAAHPTVYKITDKDFLTRDLEPPVRFKELTRNYNFYWMYFPIALFPRRNWAFNLLEVKVEFNPEDTRAHARPRAYQILPEKRFQTLLEVSDRLEVRIDENFQFSADSGDLAGQLGVTQGALQAGVNARLAAGLGMVAGPFVYRLKWAQIDHTPTGMEKVFWRLDGAEFFQENDPTLIVICQVPKETEEVRVVAGMQAYRKYDYLSADLRSFISELPRFYRNYITAGMPIRNEASWDNVTRNLQPSQTGRR